MNQATVTPSLTRRPLDADTAARMLGIDRGTLSNWRCRGEGPRYFKIGRKVTYFAADIEQFIESSAVETKACR